MDFQFAKYGYCVEDIAVLLCTSVDACLRRRFTNHFLEVYAAEINGTAISYDSVRPQGLHSTPTLHHYNRFMVVGFYVILLSFEAWLGGCVVCPSVSILNDEFLLKEKKRKLLQRFVDVAADVFEACVNSEA